MLFQCGVPHTLSGRAAPAFVGLRRYVNSPTCKAALLLVRPLLRSRIRVGLCRFEQERAAAGDCKVETEDGEEGIVK